jgi:NAD(P)-dependent dehydrogenase (short-subunit alcohol dehydrogenase family)
MSSPSDWLGLGGKLCVVTGAGGGMGRAIAASLADAGARLVLLERDAGLLETVTAEATRPGISPPLAIGCDVSDPASVTAAATRCLAECGTPDVLVNNAGLLRPGPLAELTLADWNGLLAINLSGYFLCAQAFGAPMRGRGGAMVHVASIAAAHAQGFSGAYSVSKAGVVMLSRQIATEWGPDGVRSNVVSPGMVETPMSAAFYVAPGVRERRSAVVPRGRIGTPQDIADAVLFLASARADYVSGDEVVVDGGFTRGIMNLVPRPGHDRK